MTNIIITPSQCRAARELLDWKQDDLAYEANVSQATISGFESGTSQKDIKLGTLMDITDAFENEGIRFKNSGGKIGVLLMDYED